MLKQFNISDLYDLELLPTRQSDNVFISYFIKEEKIDLENTAVFDFVKQHTIMRNLVWTQYNENTETALYLRGYPVTKRIYVTTVKTTGDVDDVIKTHYINLENYDWKGMIKFFADLDIDEFNENLDNQNLSNRMEALPFSEGFYDDSPF